MGKIELHGREIVDVVSSLVLGEVSYTIDDSSRSFLFKIENRGHKWVARGDISITIFDDYIDWLSFYHN